MYIRDIMIPEDCLRLIINNTNYSDKLTIKNVNKIFNKIIIDKKEDLVFNTHVHSPKTCEYVYNYFNKIYNL